jgi:hypothetical protein
VPDDIEALNRAAIEEHGLDMLVDDRKYKEHFLPTQTDDVVIAFHGVKLNGEAARRKNISGNCLILQVDVS